MMAQSKTDSGSFCINAEKFSLSFKGRWLATLSVRGGLQTFTMMQSVKEVKHASLFFYDHLWH